TSNSSVTYSEVAGTAITGPNRRSNRVAVPPGGPSIASGWNAAFEVVPQNVEDVVHGTVLAPAPWTALHPVGRVPGAAASKCSARRSVDTGVPGCSVARSVTGTPPEPMASRRSSMSVPATNVGSSRIATGVRFVAVAPGAIGPYRPIGFVTVTPGVEVVTSTTSARICRALSGLVM